MATNLTAMVGDKLFKLGDSGAVVMAAQFSLRDLGYKLKGTGWYGPATDTAVSAFQRRAGIHVDGVLGAETALALDAAGSIKPDGPAAPAAPAAEIGRPLWLEAAIALLGTKEVQGSGDSRTILDWAKEEGGSIAKEYTHDVIPWCALFENHIFTKVGIKGTETLWALDWAGKWPSVRLAGPAVGAVAPMLRDGGGHVTTVAGRDQAGHVMGLGGNQHDAVTIAPFARERLNQGYWWPISVAVPALVGFDRLPLINSSGRISTNEA